MVGTFLYLSINNGLFGFFNLHGTAVSAGSSPSLSLYVSPFLFPSRPCTHRPTAGASTELSILVAYGGFAIICKIKGLPLTVGTLFSSLALLRISLDPLFLLIQGTPTLVSFFKCLGRIQELLNDDRQIEQYSAKSLESSTSSLTRSDEAGRSGSRSSGSTRRSSSRSSSRVGGPIPPPLLAARSTRPVYGGLAPPRPFRPSQSLVDITNASFCWKEKDTPAVTVMELSIHRSSFTAVIGP